MKKQLLLPEALTRLKTILSQKQFLKIFALSAIFCFSVVCDNTSLRYAIGAATSFFNAISTFLLTCKKEFAEVYCALMPVVLVIVLASNNEPLFYLLGFLVLGNVKAALAAVVLVLIFRNPVTVMGMTEFTVTTMITVLYSKVKKRFKISTH
ncbi:putative sugar phosphate/phosphate translocator [Citrus sinensis]|nr:putative sugar phosphate/phosphate translocator [Citrus sinensis]